MVEPEARCALGNQSHSSIECLWVRLLPPTGRTDIVITDSSFGFFQGLLDHQLTLSEYLNPNMWAKALPPDGGRADFVQRQARNGLRVWPA